jgi:hypothetical protein
MVGDVAERFRACRQLSAAANDDIARQTFKQMADELDAEADLIDANERNAAAN